MATYAIGDVHGCFDTLRALLDRLPFDPAADRLWLVGDLVNRGPRSLEVLRWARELAERMGGRFQAVLGNHDLRLVAVGRGVAEPRRGDTLDEVLEAPDRDALLGWLGGLPLLHRDGDRLLVHAGLLPGWTPGEAERRAREVEAALSGPPGDDLLRRPEQGEDDPVPSELREALAAFTLLRTCTPGGDRCPHSGPPDQAPAGCIPWFEVPGRASAEFQVVCGHWSALGLHLADGVAALDSGVVWGGALSALRLDDREVFQQPALEPPAGG
jgi:bis(5'-nucleosyl)-tetraphosphatase (symmetrical)